MSRTVTIGRPDWLPADVKEQEKLWDEYEQEKEQEQSHGKTIVETRCNNKRKVVKPLRQNEHKAGTLTVTFAVDGKRVVATCVTNNTVHTGAAKCHPQDAFDLRTGMELAMKRMLDGYSMHTGTHFYFLDEQFNVQEGTWHGSQREKTMMNNGNVFANKFMAEKVKKELKQFFKAKIKDFSVGGLDEW